jgi:Putative Ig domain
MDRRYGLVWFAAVLIACVMIAGCGGGGTAALMVTTTSLPDGTVNTPYSFTLVPTGGTPPYTWSQVSGGNMPPGITFSSGGVFTGVPTAAGSYGPYTLKVTDANSNTATSVGLSIKVSASTLSVTTTSFPNGTIGTAYSATLAATGGKSPYSWSEISGGALPPGLTTASGTGVITGTPTTAGTYGPYVFQVTDENSTTATSGSLTIIISGTATAVCAPVGSEGTLTSATPYAFLLKGTDKSGNPLDIAGSFTPNGTGGISNAVADYNGTSDGPQLLQVNLAGSSYSFSPSGQGCLYLAFSGLASSTSSVRKANAEPRHLETGDAARARKTAKPAIVAVPVSNVQFSFYLSGLSLSTNVYSTGRIIESDTATSGTNAAGMIHVQEIPAGFTLPSQANYAFGVDGWTTTAPGILRTAMAGSFTNTAGTLSLGFADVNAGGTASGEVTGGYGTLDSIDPDTPSTGRGTGSYFLSTPTGRITYDFAYYVLNTSDFLLISTAYTQNSSTTPLLAGRALASTTGYAAAPLSGYYLLASQGYQSLGTNIGNIAQIGTMNATSAGTIPTATIYSNYAGTSNTNQYPGSSYSVEAASGRTSLAGILTNSPVVYLTNTTPDDGIVGFLVGTDNQASSGVVVNQTATTPSYSLATVSGAYPAGTAEDVDGKNGSFLGNFSFTGSGAYTVASQTTGTLTNVPSAGSIAINADGSGNLDGGNFPLVTNGQVIYAISNSGDPLLFVFEEGTLP